MKVVVVSHGSIKDYDFTRKIMKSADVIVCADGGCEYVLKCGLIPDALIGDLDSINEKYLSEVRKTKCVLMKYPKEKDFTDTQLAVDYAIDIGADEITMLGSIGDRIDHTLANIFLMIKLLMRGKRPCIIDEKNEIYITDGVIKLSGEKGDLVSLLPAGGDVTGIYTEGLMYKLSGATITMGDPLGISNVFTENAAVISIESGYLLVVKSRD